LDTVFIAGFGIIPVVFAIFGAAEKAGFAGISSDFEYISHSVCSLCGCFHMRKRGDTVKKLPPLFWVLKRVRKRVPALVLLILINAASAGMGVVFALGTRNVIDTATTGIGEDFWAACLYQVGIIVTILFLLTFSRHLHERLLADLERDWKRDLLRGLLHGEYASVSAYHSGELLNRLNNDVRIVNDGLGSALPRMVSMVVKLVAALAAVAILEPLFALLISVVGGIVVLATGLMRRHLKGLHKKVSQMDGVVSSFLQETLEKLLMVQAMDVSAEMERRADALLQERYDVQRKRKNVSLFANTSVSVMSYGASFAALVWCASGLLSGSITFGTLTAITQLVSQLQAPFTGISSAIPQYIAMTASAERLAELQLITGEPDASGCSAHVIYGDMDALCASELVFSYDRDRVLNGADFSIPKGAFVAITGPSGIGKSTLLKLFLGIYRPESGALYLESGEDKVLLDRSMRRLFAYVPQGNLILSGTVRENLLIVRPDATEEQIRKSIHISAMDLFLDQLPMGLDTQLGENGAGLSEGQTQRLAIARAILSGAPILLLDESTSALDEETEQIVLNRIRSQTDCTCIAVTHRPAFTKICDYILNIQGGLIDVRSAGSIAGEDSLFF
jgi:ATP-binding cassette subfamily B protein